MDAFRLPPVKGLSMNLGKRKLPEEPTEALLKKYRADDGAARERTRIEDVNDEDEMEEDDEPAGPSLPDDFDGDEDEEGGRMYGGGITSEMRRVFEVVDQLDEEKPQTLDSAGLKRLLLKFERALEKNQELRVKHADDPMKFLESEADLDTETHGLMQLTSAPQLYPELIRLGAVDSILSLLSHENIDIVLSGIELLNEMTDEEIVPEEDGEAEEEGVQALVKALLAAQALELVVQNLSRLDESKEDERKGVFNVLGFIENIIAIDSTAAKTVAMKTDILAFLGRRIETNAMDSNKQYASEILAILLQADAANRAKFLGIMWKDSKGIDVLLRCLSKYRKRDPAEDEEIEYMENLFDAVCALLQEPEGKEQFLANEGLELMLIMLKEKQMARMRALKVVDHALTGTGKAAESLCRQWIEVLGLKTLFAVFMRKGTKALRKQYKAWSEVEEDEHSIAIISSLFANIFDDDELRSRLMGKFEEENCEKVDRLVEMWETYSARVARVEDTLEDDELELDEDDLLARKLEEGLFTLQQCAKVIGYLALAGGAAYDHLLQLLTRRKQSVESISSVLRELADQLEGDERGKVERLVEGLVQ